MQRFWTRVRSAGRALWRAEQLDAEMDDEMRFHLEMEAERLMREGGLDPREARRQAHVRFGGVEKYKEEGRETRALQWLDAVLLDARLGVRMLIKHRGLTLVGGFAMAVAIAISATAFEVITEMLNPALPLEEGDRVVSVQQVSIERGRPDRRVLHDFATWRDELVSIEHLGAFRTVQHNLVTGQAPPEPIKVAEMTASGFALARTPPLMGRPLLPDDEREGASPVVVIGHRAWESRFGGDPQLVGRTIMLGGVPHTVVGIMPPRFRFPYNHEFWIPLRANPLAYRRLEGPQLYLFGRLAPGVTLEEAQAELTAVGQRAAAADATHGQMRPLVLPYTREHLDLSRPATVWLFRLAQLVVGALSFIVAVNLAILVYARTVTRLGEIAVRTALGASRRRILAQLFVEAFALSVAGAATGLVLSQNVLGQLQLLGHANGGVPFWIAFELSAGTVAYALGLAVLAALIMGVLPGLKATGQSLTANLHELNGRHGARLGPIWTTLVVAQVAVTVAILPVAVYMSWQVMRMEIAGPGFAAERFVVGTVAVSHDSSRVDVARIRARQLELVSRLEAEPGVSAVAFSSNIPGFSGGRRIQFDPSTPFGAQSSVFAGELLDVSTVDIGLETFGVFDAEILAGRAFTSADLGAARTVVVNRTFAQMVLGRANALGLRFRYARSGGDEPAMPEQWYQVVGVVRDFPTFPPVLGTDAEPVIYHPAAPGELDPFVLAVKFGGDVPAGFIDRFRQLGAEVDPALQLRRVVPLAAFYDEQRSFFRYLGWGIAVVTTSVLLLSAAGIYALMAFTVAQRTREIGIRTALGAHPRTVLLGVFARAIRQLTLGVLVGSLLSGAAFSIVGLDIARAVPLLVSVATIMLMVGVLAAFGPARRSLRISASDALRADT